MKDVAGDVQEMSFLTLSQQQMHHATNVLRLKIGSEIKVFNKKIGEWSCSICDIKKTHCTM